MDSDVLVGLPKAKQQRVTIGVDDDRTVLSRVLETPLDLVAIAAGQTNGPREERHRLLGAVDHKGGERRPSRGGIRDSEDIIADERRDAVDQLDSGGHRGDLPSGGASGGA